MTLLHTVLLVLMGVAAATDLHERRIPNPLVLVGLLLGPALSAQAGGLPSLGASLLGAAAALLALFGPFARGWMGGGDVKLLMVVGAFLGWKGALFVLLVGTAAHGLVALGLLLASRLSRSIGRPGPDTRRVPHALGFGAAATVYTLAASGLRVPLGPLQALLT